MISDHNDMSFVELVHRFHFTNVGQQMNNVNNKMAQCQDEPELSHELKLEICQSMYDCFQKHRSANENELMDHIYDQFEDRVHGGALIVCVESLIYNYGKVSDQIGNPESLDSEELRDAKELFPVFEAVAKALQSSDYYMNFLRWPSALGQQEKDPNNADGLSAQFSQLHVEASSSGHVSSGTVGHPSSQLQWTHEQNVAMIRFMRNYYKKWGFLAATQCDMLKELTVQLQLDFPCRFRDVKRHMRSMQSAYFDALLEIEPREDDPSFNKEEMIAKRCPFYEEMKEAMKEYRNIMDDD